MTQPTPWRFFALVLRPTPGVCLAGFAIVLFGAFLLSTDPDQFDQAPALALCFQMFAASTSYREPLRRGHFDSILVGRRSRWAVAAAHWAASSAPGFVVWFALSAEDLLMRPHHWPTTLLPSGLLAILHVSTLAWMVTLASPRYTGGVLWLITMVALASGHQMGALRVAFIRCATSWTAAVRGTGAALVVPLVLVAHPDAAGPLVFVLLTVATMVVGVVGAWMLGRFDAVLAEP